MCETTNEDLSLFIKEFYKWVNKFGLHSIRYEFRIGDTEGSYATFNYDYRARTCAVTLSDSELPEEGREDLIKDSALHEFIEGALLGPLLVLGEQRDYNQDEVEAVVHGIVYNLQYVLRERF
jgi:hypothetical protein